MIFLIDDTKIKDMPITCYGGIVIYDDDLWKLEEIAKKVKKKHGIQDECPIKGHMKDQRIEDFFKKFGQYAVYDKIIKLKEYAQIHREIIEEMKDINYTIIISSLRRVKQKHSSSEDWIDSNLPAWAFTNLLQRFGMLALNRSKQCKSGNELYWISCDWEEKKSGKRDIFAEAFQGAYIYGKGLQGETYTSGPLNHYNFVPFLSFTPTLYSPIHQLNDIILYNCRMLLDWCLRGKNKGAKPKDYYCQLIDKFDKSESGEILGYGIVHRPKEDEETLKASLDDLRRLCSNDNKRFV